MIETALVFIRNCVMAVLTAWAGIQIAEQAKPKAEPAQAEASLIHASDDGANCPHRAGPANAEPSSSAAITGQDRTRRDSEQRVLTIR